MTIEMVVTVKPGVQWAVVSGMPSCDEPGIIIPISSLEFMTDDEIAITARSLVEKACLVRASEQSDYWFRRLISNKEIKEQHLIECASEVEKIETYAGLDEDVDRLLDLIRRTKERIAAAKIRRVDHKAKTRVIRSNVQSQYNDIFVAIGRRDGFYCQSCGLSTDLQIDHIRPVSKNGTSDLDNLQLLCGPCNLAKSDRIDGET